jgi:AmmeMemoRadiSam system protein A
MSSLPENQFSAEDRRAMLALARDAIVTALEAKSLRHIGTERVCFSLRRGVFVTLEACGKLRGCIGVIEAHDPLRESIVHCAQSAAFRDPRFPPLQADELHGLRIEISVLSGVFPIDPDGVEIGKHGLVVAAGNNRGLLLPQVATENNLSKEEFLEETCRKAGLPRDAWRDLGTSIFAFTCEAFREDSGAAAA